MPKKLTTESFIAKARAIHGDKYNYILVEYENTRTTVEIICRKHTFMFEQLPHNHINGSGCPKCGNEAISNKLKLYSGRKYKKPCKTNAKFIEDAKAVHGEKYDYSQTEYTHSQVKIKILCKVHGEFLQTPNCHLIGCGCPKCGVRSRPLGTTECRAKRGRPHKTTADFIQNAKAAHGETYDYSQTEYTHSKTKVKIVCKIHGEFLMRPETHLTGYGCQKCRNPNVFRLRESK